jgi:hypothetical protein
MNVSTENIMNKLKNKLYDELTPDELKKFKKIFDV